MSEYYVLICDKCKTPQMGTGAKTMKCKKCEYVNKYENPLTHQNRNYLLMTCDPSEASSWVRNLKAVCHAVEETKNYGLIGEFFMLQKQKMKQEVMLTG